MRKIESSDDSEVLSEEWVGSSDLLDFNRYLEEGRSIRMLQVRIPFKNGRLVQAPFDHQFAHEGQSDLTSKLNGG